MAMASKGDAGKRPPRRLGEPGNATIRRAAALALYVEHGEADPKHLAYLTDRVRMAEGRPQLYGTQVADIRDGKAIRKRSMTGARRSVSSRSRTTSRGSCGRPRTGDSATPPWGSRGDGEPQG
jgi:hypothetical protein